MAGKVHALMARRYSKGRDWYDLVWYLSQRPAIAPNLPLLEKALGQTQGPHPVDARQWREGVRRRLLSINMKALLEDVSPFLERPQDAKMMTRENLLALLELKQ